MKTNKVITGIMKNPNSSFYSLTSYRTTTPAVRKNYEIPRKLFHMSGAIIPFIYYFSGMTREIAIGFFIPAIILIVGSDILRQMHGGFNKLFTNWFGKLLRAKEANSFHTSTYFVLAAFFVISLFDKKIASTALLFLSFGDPIAAMIGRKYGEIKLIDGKSLEGTFACFQTCFIIGLLMLRNPWAALVGAFAAAGAELLPLPLNDNIRIPVFSAFVLGFLI